MSNYDHFWLQKDRDVNSEMPDWKLHKPVGDATVAMSSSDILYTLRHYMNKTSKLKKHSHIHILNIIQKKINK